MCLLRCKLMGVDKEMRIYLNFWFLLVCGDIVLICGEVFDKNF